MKFQIKSKHCDRQTLLALRINGKHGRRKRFGQQKQNKIAYEASVGPSSCLTPAQHPGYYGNVFGLAPVNGTNKNTEINTFNKKNGSIFES